MDSWKFNKLYFVTILYYLNYFIVLSMSQLIRNCFTLLAAMRALATIRGSYTVYTYISSAKDLFERNCIKFD